jgi:hypothetical protein
MNEFMHREVSSSQIQLREALELYPCCCTDVPLIYNHDGIIFIGHEPNHKDQGYQIGPTIYELLSLYLQVRDRVA